MPVVMPVDVSHHNTCVQLHISHHPSHTAVATSHVTPQAQWLYTAATTSAITIQPHTQTANTWQSPLTDVFLDSRYSSTHSVDVVNHWSKMLAAGLGLATLLAHLGVASGGVTAVLSSHLLLAGIAALLTTLQSVAGGVGSWVGRAAGGEAQPVSASRQQKPRVRSSQATVGSHCCRTFDWRHWKATTLTQQFVLLQT